MENKKKTVVKPFTKGSREYGVHMAHCNQGDNLISCKYGQDDRCPAFVDKTLNTKKWKLQLSETIEELEYHKMEFRKLCSNLWPKLMPWHYVTMDWKCEESPIGYCVYHNVEDRAHDECIFCGQPEERK